MNKPNTKFYVTLVVVLSSLTSMAQDVKSEIAKAEQNFCEVFANTGGVGLKDLYATDAKILPPASAAISGNEAIGGYWKGGYDAGVKKLKLETVEVEAAGKNMATEVGNYILLDASGKQIDTGKYLVVWKKVNNSWKLYRDIWNTSATPK